MTLKQSRLIAATARLRARGEAISIESLNAEVDAALRAADDGQPSAWYREQEHRMNDYRSPDPYSEGIKALIARNGITDRDRFEAEYRIRAAIVCDRERIESERTRPALRTMSAEDIQQYAPPDCYAAGIEAMRAAARNSGGTRRGSR